MTNFREADAATRADAPSRGELVPAFLRSGSGAARYLDELQQRATQYAGFNLLLGDATGLHYYTNVGGTAPRVLGPGIYGLSNHRLDEPWPKLVRTRERFAAVLHDSDPAPATLLDLLGDSTPAALDTAPDAGLPADLERALSAPFVRHERYGTRCSTVVLVTYDGRHDGLRATFRAHRRAEWRVTLRVFGSAWMSVARRVLHLRRAIAWCGVLLSLAFAASAGAADRIEIDIQGVDREIANNVRGYLTLARYTERDDLTDAQVRRLADRAVDEAADGLRPFGYYEPTIRSRTSRDDPRWIVRLKIQPGEPVRMDEVQVQLQGAGSNEPDLLALAPASVLQPGKRLDHAAYDRLRADLLRTAIDLGYLDARLTRRELLVDPPNRKASAFLELDTGGRYSFGAVTVRQDVLDPDLLQRFVRFQPGIPFSNSRIRSTQFALEDSNFFSEVRITAGERDPATLTVPITIEAEPIKRDRYSVSLGYGTDTNVRGKFAWDNRRINQHGHRSRLELTASSVLQEAIARYMFRSATRRSKSWSSPPATSTKQLGDLDSERIELTAGLTQVLGRWQRVLFLHSRRKRPAFRTAPRIPTCC